MASAEEDTGMISTLLVNMFHLCLPVAEKILRPVIVYGFLIGGLRLAGKREMAQLNPFDLVVLLTISNTVQNAIIGEDISITGGIIGAATLLVVNHCVVRFLYSHKRLECLIEGAPTVLIEHGAIKEEQLRKELITPAEIELAAHRQGFGSLEEIDCAVLDPGGSISFTPNKPTPGDVRHDEIVQALRQISAQLAARS